MRSPELSEGRIGRRLQRTLSLDDPTTIRKRLMGYETWFQSDVATMPYGLRYSRRIANQIRDYSDSTFAREAVASLPHKYKIMTGKFKGINTLLLSGLWGNSVVLDRDKTQPGRSRSYRALGRWVEDNKALEQHENALMDLCKKYAAQACQAYPDESWEFDYRGAIGEILTDLVGGTTAWLGLFPRTRLLCHDSGYLRVLESKGLLSKERLRAETAEFLYQDVVTVGSMLKDYYTPIKESEVAGLDAALKKVWWNVAYRLVFSVLPDDGMYARGSMAADFAKEAVDSLPTFAGELVIQEIRGSLPEGDGGKSTTLDRLATWMVRESARKFSAYYSQHYGAGIGTGMVAHDESFFTEQVAKAERAAMRVYVALQALGVRPFTKPAVLFNVRDWNETLDDKVVGGYHHSGNRRAPQATGKINAGKHDHWVQVFVNASATEDSLAHVLAHEIGHAVYNFLPTEQQQWVLKIARTMPTSDYSRTDYKWSDNAGVGLSHRTGNEWFAEMLASAVMHPELFNRPISRSGGTVMAGDKLFSRWTALKTWEVHPSDEYLGFRKTPEAATPGDVQGMLGGFKRAFYAASPDDAAGYKPGVVDQARAVPPAPPPPARKPKRLWNPDDSDWPAL